MYLHSGCVYVVSCLVYIVDYNVFGVFFFSYYYFYCIVLNSKISYIYKLPAIWYIFQHTCVDGCCIFMYLHSGCVYVVSCLVYIVDYNVFGVFFFSYYYFYCIVLNSKISYIYKLPAERYICQHTCVDRCCIYINFDSGCEYVVSFLIYIVDYYIFGVLFLSNYNCC